jgi:Zn-dependent M28 family amino/carboxypeptidase
MIARQERASVYRPLQEKAEGGYKGMRRVRITMALAMALVVALAAVGVASAAVKTNTSELRRAVTNAGVMEHLEAFQAIADANGGTRVAGSPGYDASVEYVAERLRAAGYNVSLQNFTFDAFEEDSPSVFERVSPSPEVYTDEDFLTMSYSGNGDVTAPLEAVGGIVIPSPGGSVSGCSPADFADFTEGSIALIQRGDCSFRQKAENAEAAGAVGVVIFNEGNEDPADDRLGVVNGTLDPPRLDIPVIGTSFAVGEELYALTQQGRVVVHLKVDASVVTTKGTNVIADTRAGREDRTVVVGAHLDSVEEGPGINDNGSGSATILEVAEEMSELGISPRNQVRFAFWGAEEAGLIGSEHYVSTLTKRDIKDIAVNLNFDMLASPNYARFVYDGDGSATPDAGPTGSGVVEDVFNDYFASRGLETEPTEFDGRSDYGPFIDAGIPAGGLFTGAEGIKTPREERIYGGVAGLAHDPCYHAACDTLKEADQSEEVRRVEQAYGENVIVGNINTKALREMSDGVAHATLAFAQTTSAVGGTEKGNGTPSSAPQYKGPKALR